MTGIERLVDIVTDGPYSGGMIHISVQKLREICEQIEREVADISGYRSAVVAFVEEKGGLDELERRLMPEGMVWPRFEDGELVGFGDEYVNAKGNVSTLRTIVIKDCRDRLGGGYYWKLGKGACAVVVKNGERIKRPPVLAADGKPLEVGQTVWHVSNGIKFAVIRLPKSGEYQAVKLRLDDGAFTGLDPDQLTHQRPVLDADGAPIKVGDTVFRTSDGREFEVTGVDGAFEIRVKDESMDVGIWTTPCGFTHTKPEPPDSRQRIEEDKDLNPFNYCKKVGHKLWTFDNAEEFKASDLVRRCRALAERERDE